MPRGCRRYCRYWQPFIHSQLCWPIRVELNCSKRDENETGVGLQRVRMERKNTHTKQITTKAARRANARLEQTSWSMRPPLRGDGHTGVRAARRAGHSRLSRSSYLGVPSGQLTDVSVVCRLRAPAGDAQDRNYVSARYSNATDCNYTAICVESGPFCQPHARRHGGVAGAAG